MAQSIPRLLPIPLTETDLNNYYDTTLAGTTMVIDFLIALLVVLLVPTIFTDWLTTLMIAHDYDNAIHKGDDNGH